MGTRFWMRLWAGCRGAARPLGVSVPACPHGFRRLLERPASGAVCGWGWRVRAVGLAGGV